MAATGLATFAAGTMPESAPERRRGGMGYQRRNGRGSGSGKGDYLNTITNKMLARGWRPRPLGQGWPKVKVAR